MMLIHHFDKISHKTDSSDKDVGTRHRAELFFAYYKFKSNIIRGYLSWKQSTVFFWRV